LTLFPFPACSPCPLSSCRTSACGLLLLPDQRSELQKNTKLRGARRLVTVPASCLREQLLPLTTSRRSTTFRSPVPVTSPRSTSRLVTREESSTLVRRLPCLSFLSFFSPSSRFDLTFLLPMQTELPVSETPSVPSSSTTASRFTSGCPSCVATHSSFHTLR
jgi:hypothetical protein